MTYSMEYYPKILLLTLLLLPTICSAWPSPETYCLAQTMIQNNDLYSGTLFYVTIWNDSCVAIFKNNFVYMQGIYYKSARIFPNAGYAFYYRIILFLQRNTVTEEQFKGYFRDSRILKKIRKSNW